MSTKDKLDEVLRKDPFSSIVMAALEYQYHLEELLTLEYENKLMRECLKKYTYYKTYPGDKTGWFFIDKAATECLAKLEKK